MELLPMLPIEIVNRIINDAGILNEDSRILQFYESGKKNKQTNRLCTCCPRYIAERSCWNEYKFDVISEQLASKFFASVMTDIVIHYPDGVSADLTGNVSIIKSRTIISPGWLGEEDEMKTIQTVLIVITEGSLVSRHVYLNIEVSQDHTIRVVNDKSHIFMPNVEEHMQYESIEAATMTNGILHLYLYENNAQWLWNPFLHVMELIVQVDDVYGNHFNN
jgi:hypothetical protein